MPVEDLAVSASYDFLLKDESLPDYMGKESGAIDFIDWPESARRDLVGSGGRSDKNVLRFAPMTFSSAGTFKVCFCDVALSGKCESEKDYTVEVGKLHVSGISCLLDIPKLRRTRCYEQYFGGFSCKEEWTPQEICTEETPWKEVAEVEEPSP